MVDLLRILLIEDNPGDVLLVQEGLKETGVYFDLRVFQEGNAALKFLAGEGKLRNAIRPDVIILDLNLPGLNGMEILSRLKNDDRTRAIPVIMFSSSVAASDIHRCYDLHANCYVQKPNDLDAVFHVVKSIQTFWGRIAELPPQ